MDTIAQNIKLFRHQNSWSQRQLAKRLKISIAALSKIENGKTDINMSRLFQLADTFDTSVYVLMGCSKSDPYKAKIDQLKEKIAKIEADIMSLQQKAISLYAELLSSKK